MAGAYMDQRLNLSKLWEGPRKKCQCFKPDPGNPAVRDYRGASGNVSHGGNVHPSCNQKSGKRKPPTYSGARPISIPIETPAPDGSDGAAKQRIAHQIQIITLTKQESRRHGHTRPVGNDRLRRAIVALKAPIKQR